MELNIINPWAGLALVFLVLLWWRRSRQTAGLQLLLRGVLMSLLVLAMTRPVLFSQDETVHHVVILDQSGSVDPTAALAAKQQLQTMVAAASPHEKLYLIQIGGARWEPAGLQGAVWLESEDSPMSQALTQARSLVPWHSRGHITMLSDGLAQDQAWGKIVAELQRQQIAVDVIPLPARTEPTRLLMVKASPVRVGQQLAVTVEVMGQSEQVQVVLSSAGRELVRSEIFAVDGVAPVTLNVPTEQAGFLTLTVTLQDVSGNRQLSQQALVAAVQPPLSVLYAGVGNSSAATELNRLAGPGFVIQSVDFNQVEDFSAYDIVVLNDLPASAWSSSQQEKLRSVIEQGTGLFYAGGKAVFGAGGYADSPLAAALPVEFADKNDKSDPSVGLAIVIDTSQSMEGTRIELARQMARIAVRRLQPHDRVGIVEFYGSKHWAVPMQPATNKIEIDRAIGRMKAIGGTVLYPALQEAYYGLRGVNTKFKHILMLTDAGVEDGDYETLIRRMAKDGINVSTVLVGQAGHNQIMADLSNWGKGRFYAVGNEFQLIDMILKQPSEKQKPAYQTGQFVTRTDAGRAWWWDFAATPLPALQSYVDVQAKPRAEVLLSLAASGKPVLASWQFGAGRVTSMMTEPLGNGTLQWQQWPQYGQWLGRVLSKTALPRQDFSYQVLRQADQVFITAQRLRAEHKVYPQLVFAEESAQTTQIRFEQKTADLYVAELTYSHTADLLLTEPSTGYVLADAAADSYMAEAVADPRRAMDLQALARATQGRVLTDSSTPIAQLSQSEAITVLQLWPWLVLLALLLYLIDLLWRRWPRWLPRQGAAVTKGASQ